MTSFIASKIHKTFSIVLKFRKEISKLQIGEIISTNHLNKRISSFSGVFLQRPKTANTSSSTTQTYINDIKNENKGFKLSYSDGTEDMASFAWLRDNCQCSSCYDQMAMARKTRLIDLDINIKPKTMEYDKNCINIVWDDLHVSSFDVKWLMERALMPKAIESYRNFYRYEREPWGKDLQIKVFNFDDVMNDDRVLLSWLINMEKKGICLIQNCPDDAEAGPIFINNIAFVKRTHFGIRSSVKARDHSANLAYKNVKLGLHNDIPYYNYSAGIIFLHMVEQNKGKGGESIAGDGFLGAKLFKEKNPEGYELLCKYGIYFWDKGIGVNPGEKEAFYKLNKDPVIKLNKDGDLQAIRVNSQSRHSFIDIPPEKVHFFYSALTELNKLIYENIYSHRLEDGEILVLDNTRCLHGREGYVETSSRHLETIYIDWDEALCKRRCLEEKLKM